MDPILSMLGILGNSSSTRFPLRLGLAIGMRWSLARGSAIDELGLDANNYLDIPARQIRADNVADFQAELAANLGRD